MQVMEMLLTLTDRADTDALLQSVRALPGVVDADLQQLQRLPPGAPILHMQVGSAENPVTVDDMERLVHAARAALRAVPEQHPPMLPLVTAPGLTLQVLRIPQDHECLVVTITDPNLLLSEDAIRTFELQVSRSVGGAHCVVLPFAATAATAPVA